MPLCCFNASAIGRSEVCGTKTGMGFQRGSRPQHQWGDALTVPQSWLIGLRMIISWVC